ncbi:glycosyltransferase [Butyrivibrio sp. XB500-5]|uniref:glycosyltransferase n=1 Tax=Butyrivibrio sp. XB500-5 TaxID=2364880 RepID=UPI000EA9EB62|nr:glycosyltransferase [Butyrivibrio sp. XB500-5]RKM60698.1 glycosyltransferase [Butyrivibrio sp. XB500-5]
MKQVSVVMSTYNENEEYVREAMDSLVNQTFPDIEIIVVIDNPQNTELLDILREYESIDNRICVLRNDSNIGLAKSLNKAIAYSSGEYIARMDADDICEIDRIRIQYDYLIAHPDIDLVCSAVKRINEKGEVISTKNSVPKNDQMLMKSIRYGTVMIHPSVMFRKEAFDKVGGYNNYLAGQDLDLWIRMKESGAIFHYILEPLLFYRISQGNTTSSKSMIQGISARYCIDINRKGNCFSESDYLDYLNRLCGDSKFCDQYTRFEAAKKKKGLLSCFVIAYSALVNKVCRGKVLKNLYFIFFMKKLTV